jgi:hypothetical protein
MATPGDPFSINPKVDRAISALSATCCRDSRRRFRASRIFSPKPWRTFSAEGSKVVFLLLKMDDISGEKR